MKDLFSELNPEQCDAVLHTEGPQLVLAGAGTGKTRIVTYRIAYLLSQGIDPGRILAVTFTNKAANEMKKRVMELSPINGKYVWISTFHSFAAQLLRMESDKIGIKRNYIIYDENDQKSLIKGCMQNLNIDDKKYKVGMIHDAIMRAKDNLIDAGSYAIYADASNDYLRSLIGNVYTSYQNKLIQNNALDFGDLLLKLVEVFHNFSDMKAKYQERFGYVLVDEYQDTNHAQCMLMKHLAAKHRNLFVVGDDDQSIYSWRGADVRNILEFEKEYPGTKIVKLEQNYRSTKNILDCAWGVIRNNVLRKNKRLWTDKKEGEEVRINSYSNETEEALHVANEVTRFHKEKGLSFDSFAVFYRTNAQSRVLEETFIKEEIPYNIVGTVRFYDRMEIKDMISYLRVLINPDDSVSLKRIINTPRRGIGQTRIEKFEDYSRKENISLWKTLSMLEFFESRFKIPKRSVNAVKDFIELIRTLQKEANNLSLPELTQVVIEKTGYMKMLEEEGTYEAKDRIENIKEFISAINEFYERGNDEFVVLQNKSVEMIESFLSNVSLSENMNILEKDKNIAGRVTLMTLHLAKGLEFPVVFITGMEEGLLPIGSAIANENELEEERRLCYVGMTRAKKALYLTCADVRRIYGQIRNNIPSRFIREVQVQMMDRLPDVQKESIDYSPFGKAYKIGQRIHHAEFGKGRIIKISGSDDDVKVIVMFENGKWKKLLVKYANLRTI